MTIPNKVSLLAIVNFPWSMPTIFAFPTGTKSVFSKLQFSPDILANSSRMSPICLILSVFNSPNVVVSSANPSTFSVSLLDS